MTTQQALGDALQAKAAHLRLWPWSRVSDAAGVPHEYVVDLYAGRPVPWEAVEKIAAVLHVTISDGVRVNYLQGAA